MTKTNGCLCRCSTGAALSIDGLADDLEILENSLRIDAPLASLFFPALVVQHYGLANAGYNCGFGHELYHVNDG